MDTSIFKQIPKMDRLLDDPVIQQAAIHIPRPIVHRTIEEELDALRERLKAGAPFPDDLSEKLAVSIKKSGRHHLRKVINATGIILHTNLGRAPLGELTASELSDLASGYSNLELNLDTGRRGSRYDHVTSYLCELTGAEDAMVVNNNAAAVFLVLHTLARDKKVAISRGELVEIGGSFRVPDIMRESGAVLMEIGTTNKTHLYDYERAVKEGAEILLKVHPSNFHMKGFTEEVSVQDLSSLAERFNIPLLYDLGSAFLTDEVNAGVSSLLEVRQAAASADIVCFSGDKLLGGGQGGIILGKKSWINLIKQDPFTRILRVDKLTLSSLETVLRLCLEPEKARNDIPVLRMLHTTSSALKQQAEDLQLKLQSGIGEAIFNVVSCRDEMGGGSLPDLKLDGWAVAVSSQHITPDTLAGQLRDLPVPILGRINKDRFLLSVRTIQPGEDSMIIEGLTKVMNQNTV